MMLQTALLSVFDKTGIVEFAKELQNCGISIIASGGTANAIKAAGIAVRDVSDLVGGGAILGHRVVTLSREVHAGLLSRNLKEDIEELESKGIPRIDIICVDMYPLKDAIKKAGNDLMQVIEMTDVGGPTMLMSSAKGQRIVLCDLADRENFIQHLKTGIIDIEYVEQQDAKAQGVVADYVLASARYRSGGKIDGIIGTEVLRCKYGENAWQTPAALHSTGSDDPLALDKFKLVAGTDPSYNNICDIDRALQTIIHIAAAFDVNRGEIPCIDISDKHGNACGGSYDNDPIAALEGMIIGDLNSILGGVVMVNFPLNDKEAEILMTYKMRNDKRRILDVIVAPSFSEKAIEMFRRKKDKCRLLANHHLENLGKECLDKSLRIRQVRGGFLRQPNYTFILDLNSPTIKKFGNATVRQEDAILFAWGIGSTSNSNTITVVSGQDLIGNAVGQQSRVGGCNLARLRINQAGHSADGAVAYSDSFFPFDDGPYVLKQMGIDFIFASSGSVNDQQVIDFCKNNNITLYMIPDAEGRGFYGH